MSGSALSSAITADSVAGDDVDPTLPNSIRFASATKRLPGRR
jgi:hypothetical protein